MIYNKQWKMMKCEEFFAVLSELLNETYEVVSSCNADISKYLIPIGTVSELTYYSKPKNSVRISDHWNWFANLNKCDIPWYVQCYCADIPWPNGRLDVGKASKPRYGMQVSVFGGDGKYHAVYGEVFNRKTKKWEWLETDPADIAEMLA